MAYGGAHWGLGVGLLKERTYNDFEKINNSYKFMASLSVAWEKFDLHSAATLMVMAGIACIVIITEVIWV